jgi:undecaprenyl-diphosphatase
MDIKIILLGLIQGLTEFLPISSSGHLALAHIFLGTDMPALSYDLVLHVATACATVLFFIRDIYALLMEWLIGLISPDRRKSPGWNIGWAVVVGTMVTAVIGIAIKDFAEAAMLNSLLVGLGLLFTGAVLIVSCFIRPAAGRVRFFDGIAVGIAQGIAVLPGVSRSGMTMMAGIAAGLSRPEAFRFSFLLSIPAILGATVFQAMELGGTGDFCSTLPGGWFLGVIVAFLSGLASLAVLRKIIIASKWWVFGVYCLIMGMSAIIISYTGAW